MRKIALLMVVVLMVATPTAFAAKEGKGASEKAKEHASEKAIFNRVGDWFSTIGKSDEEKEAARVEKEARKEAKKAEKEAKKVEKKVNKKVKELKTKKEK